MRARAQGATELHNRTPTRGSAFDKARQL
jgi:hypothetical protein